MKLWAFEVLEARDGWPSPVVQDARCVDEDVAGVSLSTIGRRNFNVPLALFLVPMRRGDPAVELYPLLEVVFVCKVVEVLVYLR